MKTIARKLDNIVGIDLNNKQKSQLTGGEETENCYNCVCYNCTGAWVTKDTSQANAQAKAVDYCESHEALCGQVEMWQCWGID